MYGKSGREGKERERSMGENVSLDGENLVIGEMRGRCWGEGRGGKEGDEGQICNSLEGENVRKERKRIKEDKKEKHHMSILSVCIHVLCLTRI